MLLTSGVTETSISLPSRRPRLLVCRVGCGTGGAAGVSVIVNLDMAWIYRPQDHPGTDYGVDAHIEVPFFEDYWRSRAVSEPQAFIDPTRLDAAVRATEHLEIAARPKAILSAVARELRLS